MPEQKKRETFWTTLPGMLTAITSLITAIGGLLALFMGKSGDTSTPVRAVPVAASPSVPQDDPTQDAAACQRIAGQWVWSTGGVVTIGGDGSLQWRPYAGDPQPTVVGRWVCTDSTQRQYLFSWSHGFTDVFALSEDSKRVSGTNQQTQTRLFGNRQK